MLNDMSVSLCRVIAVTMWTISGAFIAVAWGVQLAGYWRYAALFGLTGCSLIGVAAVCHIRCIINRAARVFLALHGLDGGGREAELHSVR